MSFKIWSGEVFAKGFVKSNNDFLCLKTTISIHFSAKNIFSTENKRSQISSLSRSIVVFSPSEESPKVFAQLNSDQLRWGQLRHNVLRYPHFCEKSEKFKVSFWAFCFWTYCRWSNKRFHRKKTLTYFINFCQKEVFWLNLPSFLVIFHKKNC